MRYFNDGCFRAEVGGKAPEKSGNLWGEDGGREGVVLKIKSCFIDRREDVETCADDFQ